MIAMMISQKMYSAMMFMLLRPDLIDRRREGVEISAAHGVAEPALCCRWDPLSDNLRLARHEHGQDVAGHGCGEAFAGIVCVGLLHGLRPFRLLGVFKAGRRPAVIAR